MGVRLYPSTKNSENLERLCYVPAGTAAKLAEIEARHQPRAGFTYAEYREAQDALYDELYAVGNEHINNYHHFLVMGWGKFDDCGIAKGYTGHLSDIGQVRHILARNGICVNAELCEGLHWC